MGKSILDGIKVINKAFVLDEDYVPPPREEDVLIIVGNCPKCGAPIYGKKEFDVRAKGDPIHCFTCECRVRKSFEDTIETK